MASRDNPTCRLDFRTSLDFRPIVSLEMSVLGHVMSNILLFAQWLLVAQPRDAHDKRPRRIGSMSKQLHCTRRLTNAQPKAPEVMIPKGAIWGSSAEVDQVWERVKKEGIERQSDGLLRSRTQEDSQHGQTTQRVVTGCNGQQRAGCVQCRRSCSPVSPESRDLPAIASLIDLTFCAQMSNR